MKSSIILGISVIFLAYVVGMNLTGIDFVESEIKAPERNDPISRTPASIPAPLPSSEKRAILKDYFSDKDELVRQFRAELEQGMMTDENKIKAEEIGVKGMTIAEELVDDLGNINEQGSLWLSIVKKLYYENSSIQASLTDFVNKDSTPPNIKKELSFIQINEDASSASAEYDAVEMEDVQEYPAEESVE